MLAGVVAGADGVVADFVRAGARRPRLRGRGACLVWPISAAISSPNRKAVPLGESFLKR